MKNFIALSIISFLLFFSSSCKKTELKGSLAVYEGTWLSEKGTLILNQNGRASYNYTDGAMTKSIQDGRLIIKDNILKIKLVVKEEFTIDTPPTIDSSRNDYRPFMVLSGIEFIKQ